MTCDRCKQLRDKKGGVFGRRPLQLSGLLSKAPPQGASLGGINPLGSLLWVWVSTQSSDSWDKNNIRQHPGRQREKNEADNDAM